MVFHFDFTVGGLKSVPKEANTLEFVSFTEVRLGPSLPLTVEPTDFSGRVVAGVEMHQDAVPCHKCPLSLPPPLCLRPPRVNYPSHFCVGSVEKVPSCQCEEKYSILV